MFGLYLGSINSHCWWNEPTCPPELRTNNFNNRFVMNKINRTVNILQSNFQGAGREGLYVQTEFIAVVAALLIWWSANNVKSKLQEP